MSRPLLRILLKAHAAALDAPSADTSGRHGVPLRVSRHDRRQRVREMSSPGNARCPVSISNSTAPNAQMSARLSTALPARLLGRHVGGGAENHPRPRHRRRRDRRRPRVARRHRAGRLHRLGEPEVQHLHRAVGADFDVRGFQIAMNDPLLVRGFERVRDLLRDRQGFVDRDRAARDPLREVLALDELHHERAHTPDSSRP